MNVLTELRRRWVLVVFGLVVGLAVFGPRIAAFYTDILWFESVGYSERFFSLLYTRFGLGIAAGVVMAVLIGVNLALAKRIAPSFRMTTEAEEVIERYRQALEPFTKVAIVAVAAVMGLLAGTALVGEWRTYLLFVNAGEFGIPDPHFGRDLGFFIFELPFYARLNGWLFGTLAITIIATAGAHYIFGGIRPQAEGQKITSQANVHLSILLATLISVRAWGFWLDRFMLSYSDRGVGTGLSYTDVNAELRALTLLTVIAAVCALLFLANIQFRGFILPSAGVGILLVASLVLGGAYPAAIQALQVNPQELPRERPFIDRNLAYTRYAYDIEEVGDALEEGGGNVTYERFGATEDLTPDEVVDNAATLAAIRLWDPATLQNTYNQLQQLRPYYEFQDVDVDRYTVEGEQQQVMVSVREVNVDNLQEPSWQNRALLFTHGFGVVASTVSTAASNGQPEFLARDIPNDGVDELVLEQPRIYFGEQPPPYSIVNTAEDEFDFETAERQEFNRYDGADGVGVGNLLNRVAFSLRFGEINILLSGLIEDESRVLFNRNVRQRVEEIAPFLELDGDTYPIVVDGRVKWIQDGYTVSNMMPYSQRIDLGEITQRTERRTILAQAADGSFTPQERVVNVRSLTGEANYIRNSVKAVVDAYDGTVDLYITDSGDPIIQAWDRAFPNTLIPEEQIPEEIEAHFRHPEDMFRVQAAMLRRYHIPDADGFYTASDEWQLPSDSAFSANENTANAARNFPPTYQLIRLPGDEQEDFSLIQPFSPAEREVLSAYMAARGNPGQRGEIRILQMPPTRTVFGPEQVFARINQDSEVSQLITLLSRQGSEVIFGNLIVVPIEDSLLYSLPLFLKAEQFDIPELRRVVLVYGNDVVIEESLGEALESLFGDLPDVLDGVTALPEGDEADIDPLDIPEDLEDVGDAADAPVDGADDTDEGAAPPLADIDVSPEVQDLIAQAIEAFAAADLALQEGDLGEYQERVREAEALLAQIEAALSS
jgi:uncharacterized protein